MAVDLVRRREVGGVDQHRPADVDEGGGRHDALAVDRDGLRAGQPELLDDGPQVAAAVTR